MCFLSGRPISRQKLNTFLDNLRLSFLADATTHQMIVDGTATLKLHHRHNLIASLGPLHAKCRPLSCTDMKDVGLEGNLKQWMHTLRLFEGKYIPGAEEDFGDEPDFKFRSVKRMLKSSRHSAGQGSAPGAITIFQTLQFWTPFTAHRMFDICNFVFCQFVSSYACISRI